MLSLATLVPVPHGFETLEQISVRLKNEEDVIAYAFADGRIVPTRITRVCEKPLSEHRILSIFDDDNELICSSFQEFLTRNSDHASITQIAAGTAMMPFERRKLTGGYWYVYTVARNGECGKGSNWYSEHRMLAEFILERRLKWSEVVHHADFNQENNSLDNLIVMSSEDHVRLHELSAQNYNAFKWGPNNLRWQAKFKNEHSNFMINSNPSERKDVTYQRVLDWCKLNGFERQRAAIGLECDERTIDHKLRKAGYSGFSQFALEHYPSWRSNGGVASSKNPRWRAVSFQSVCDAYKPGKHAKQIAVELNTTLHVVIKRVKLNGYDGWKDFVARYKNCKLVTKTMAQEMPTMVEITTSHGTIAVGSVVALCLKS
jgi:hypothetical protein